MSQKKQNEIRVRQVPDSQMKKVKAMEATFHVKTTPDVINTLIDRYDGDQEAIRQLQARNRQLHSAIKKYYDKEDKMKSTIQTFINLIKSTDTDLSYVLNNAKKTIKLFGTKRSGR